MSNESKIDIPMDVSLSTATIRKMRNEEFCIPRFIYFFAGTKWKVWRQKASKMYFNNYLLYIKNEQGQFDASPGAAIGPN